MSTCTMTRRELLRNGLILGAGIAGASSALGACAPQPQPAQEGQAVGPEDTSAPAPAEDIELRYIYVTGTFETRYKEGARIFQEKYPEITLKPEPMSYSDVQKKTQLMGVAGTLSDVIYQSGRWVPMHAHLGLWHPLDDLVASEGWDASQYYPFEVEACHYEGKLVDLPDNMHIGVNSVYFNIDLYEQAGADLPHTGWTWEEYTEGMRKIKKELDIFGKNSFNRSWHAGQALYRCWNGSALADDHTTCTFNMPETQEAFRLQRAWVHDDEAMPKRGEQADDGPKAFAAGRQATLLHNVGNGSVLVRTVGDKFKWNMVLWPGSAGEVGTVGFVGSNHIYSKSEHPVEGFKLMVEIANPEIDRWQVINHGMPPFTPAVLTDEEVLTKYPWYRNVLAKFEQGIQDFPMPKNLRYSEVQDVYGNDVEALLYDDIEYNQANIDQVTDNIQVVLDKELP